MTASEALACGLIRHVVPHETLGERVDALAHEIADTTSATAIMLTKRMLVASEGMSAAQAATFLSAYNALARQTKDCHDGVRAFLEKRG